MEKKLNIFVIPSWYPSPTSPLSGIFCKEQPLYVAQLVDHSNTAISLWGQDDLFFDLRKPGSFPHALLKRCQQSTGNLNIKDNLIEFYSPALTWNRKLGGLTLAIKSNLYNFKNAEEKFGKIDIIHAHVSYPGGYIAKILSEKFEIPYIITEHMGGPFPFKHLLDKDRPVPQVDEAIRNAKKVIAVSPSQVQAIEKFGYKNVIYIPNIVDEDHFKPDPEEKGRKIFTFFTLGSMSHGKGIDILLKSYRALKNKGIEFQAVIGGNGDELQNYKELCTTLALDGLITWKGEMNRTEVLYAYQNCDAFVLPSRHESFGLVYVEALACGKPVIATKCGGPEAFVNLENGILVDRIDSDLVASALEEMIKEINKFDKKKIRDQFLQNFSKTVVVPKIFSLYKELVS